MAWQVGLVPPRPQCTSTCAWLLELLPTVMHADLFEALMGRARCKACGLPCQRVCERVCCEHGSCRPSNNFWILLYSTHHTLLALLHFARVRRFAPVQPLSHLAPAAAQVVHLRTLVVLHSTIAPSRLATTTTGPAPPRKRWVPQYASMLPVVRPGSVPKPAVCCEGRTITRSPAGPGPLRSPGSLGRSMQLDTSLRVPRRAPR